MNESETLTSVSDGIVSDLPLPPSPAQTVPRYMNPVNAYIDAEWASDGVTICLQVLLHSSSSPARYYIVMNEKYRSFLSDKGYVEGSHRPFYDALLLFSDFDVDHDNLTPLLQDYCSKYGMLGSPVVDSLSSESDDDVSEHLDVELKEDLKENLSHDFVRNKQLCNLYLFYSPKDILYIK